MAPTKSYAFKYRPVQKCFCTFVDHWYTLMYWNKSLLCLRSLAERCAMCSYIAVFRMATSFTHSNCFCNTLLVMFLNQSQFRALSTTHCPRQVYTASNNRLMNTEYCQRIAAVNSWSYHTSSVRVTSHHVHRHFIYINVKIKMFYKC